MKEKDDLAENLIKSDDPEIAKGMDSDLARIHSMIRKEKRKLLEMKLITSFLWVCTIAVLLLKITPRSGMSANYLPIRAISLYLGIAAQFLPIAAGISSLLLLFRLFGSRRQETNLRLMAIEEQLRRLGEKRP